MPSHPASDSASLSRHQSRRRILAAVLAPVFALVAFGTYVVGEKLESYRASADLLAAAKLVGAAQGLARELQDERSRSTLFLGTGRTGWRSEVEEQREETDRMLAEFRAILAQSQTAALFGRARPDLGLGNLDGLRAGVDGDADVRRVLEGYSELVSAVIGVSSKLATGDLGNLVAAYMDLGHIKDRIARERSIGDSWLIKGRTDRSLMELFAETHAEKAAFIESFRSHAAPEQARLVEDILRGPLYAEADRLHLQALGGRLREVNAGSWHRTHLALGEQFAAAEQTIAGSMEQAIADDMASTKNTFYLVVIGVVALVAFSVESLRRSERRAALAEEEARKLFRAVEQSPVSVMITDPDGIIEYVNPDFTRMTGFSRDEVIGQNPRILRATQASPDLFRELWATIRAGHEWKGEISNRRKDGSLYWETMTVAPVKGPDGKVVNYIALKEDISEVKTLRSALEQETANLRRVMERLSDGIALVNGDGRFDYANPALEAEFGPVEGRAAQDYFGEPLLAGATAPIRREWRSPRTGKVYDLLGTPVQTPEGSTAVLHVFHDITLRKRTEEALTGAREAAEMANRAKSEFLATMSHELRTPLNAIIGFSEIIEAELLGPVGQGQYREYAHDINESGRHLLRLINDILDVARLDVGRVELREQAIDVAALLDSGLCMVRERAEAGQLELVIQPPPTPLPLLWGDEQRLKQVLVNVLGNAVKFTPAGGRVEVSARAGDGAGLDLIVRDTGIGIDPEQLDRVMSPFAQADSSLSRRYGGSGLGLPLAGKLMALHGGSVHLDSTPGEGTSVTLRFPQDRLRATVQA